HCPLGMAVAEACLCHLVAHAIAEWQDDKLKDLKEDQLRKYVGDVIQAKKNPPAAFKGRDTKADLKALTYDNKAQTATWVLKVKNEGEKKPLEAAREAALKTAVGQNLGDESFEALWKNSKDKIRAEVEKPKDVATKTNLKANPNPVPAGKEVTLTAKITP